MSNNIPNIKRFFPNKGIFLVSCLSILMPALISIFSLKEVDILIKIIICLSISFIVLLFDVIYYYVKEREYYYYVCYLENNITLLQNQIRIIETRIPRN